VVGDLTLNHRDASGTHLSEHKKRFCGTDQILQLLSSEADTSDVPSGEKQTERTGPECALITRDLPCTVGSQRRIVWSFEADASTVPVGLKRTSSTQSWCRMEFLGARNRREKETRAILDQGEDFLVLDPQSSQTK
jgi:hypothetical protein